MRPLLLLMLLLQPLYGLHDLSLLITLTTGGVIRGMRLR